MSINLPVGDFRHMASDARRSKLTEAMNSVNLQIRPDSNLCRSFVDGELGDEWSVQKVAHESALMHWLYNCTLYPRHLREARSQWIQFFIHEVDFNLFFRRVVLPGVKLHVINMHGGVPLLWPWLRDCKSTSH